jgi:hypothetical protein
MIEVMGIIDYLFQPSRLTINHFKDLNGIKGPDDALTDFTLEQFLGHCEPYCYIFSCGNNAALDMLIGGMYNFSGDEQVKQQLSSLDEPTKLAIFLFYNGCSNFIKNKFKNVFGGKTEIKPDGLEFARLINSLNMGDISRNEQIKSTNLYEALIFMDKILSEK